MLERKRIKLLQYCQGARKQSIWFSPATNFVKGALLVTVWYEQTPSDSGYRIQSIALLVHEVLLKTIVDNTT